MAIQKYNTLLYAGVEKTLQGWDIGEDDEIELNADTPDKFTITLPNADITNDPTFAFEGVVAVYSDRLSATGLPGSFSGGVCEFIGKRVGIGLSSSGSNGMGVTYHFQNAMYDLDNTVFQQVFKQYNGTTHATANFVMAETILFTKFNAFGALINCTTGDTINEVLQYLLDVYTTNGDTLPFQIGTIDPALWLPSYQAKPASCLEVLRKCIELSPDCKFFFDYTTVNGLGNPLPTIHCRKQANLPAANAALWDGANNAGHISIHISRRDDLVARAVRLTYKITNTVDNQQKIQYVVDKYGAHGANNALDPDGGLRVLVETIDLVGFSQTTVKGHLDCEPFAGVGGTTATKRAWWASKRGGEEDIMADTRYRFQDEVGAGTTLVDASVTDESGAAINLTTYPNRLVDGTFQPWMVRPDRTQVAVIRAVVKTTVIVTQYDTTATAGSETATNGNALCTYKKKEMTCHIALTNASTGDFTATASVTSSEGVPVGNAQAIYNSLSIIQYESDYLRVDPTQSGGITMAHKLNYTNGRGEWTTMNAQIQGIKKNLTHRLLSIRTGPAKHLAINQLMDIFNAFRFRRVWNNPQVRQTGALDGGGQSTMASNAPKANTTAGQNERINNATIIKDGGGTVVGKVETNALTVKTILAATTPSLVDATKKAHEVQPRECAFCTISGTKAYGVVMTGGLYTKP